MLSALAFALFCLVCTWFAFTRHPIWGVYFYLATTYIYPPGRWWGAMLGDLRWALLAAVVTAAAVVFHRGKLQPKPMWLSWGPAAFLAAYVAWMWVQLAWALDPPEHQRGSVELVKCLLAMWFVYRTLDSKERVRDLMLGHVLGCALLGFFAYSIGREGDRLDGVGGPNLDDANTLGMYLVTAALCGVGLVMTQTGWRRIAALLCLPLIVNGFVLANSRGAFLGLVAGALVLWFCTARQHRWVLWSFAGVGVVGLAMLVDQRFIDRMFTIGDVTSQDESADSSARSRLVIAQAQLQMFVENPFGIGWRGTVVLSPMYMDERWLAQDTGQDGGSMTRSSHSTYLTALTEQGIPGALIYAGLVLWVVGAMWRVRRLSRGPTGPPPEGVGAGSAAGASVPRRPARADPDVATLGAALLGAIAVVLVSGVTADYLTKEVQFWLYAALASVLWLGESERPVRAAEPVGDLRRASV